jgi:hypothetical protein
MRRPKGVNLGPHRIDIEWRKHIAGDLLGRAYPNRNLIQVRTSGQALSQQQSTLIHEYIHLGLGVLGLGEELEERICLHLEAPILELFKSYNGDVAAWLAST